ncbi:hypothetical protein JOF35_000249 [Streptomyces demainii]|uniref:Uncharacterized protein n=1 Tax=Streptomyces demainii TaxID=588122 RepID=A0ABT9KKA5_9ACTN|nr:hypothetical protein [Streptomyces demainii]
MRNHHHELRLRQQEMTTTPATTPARYPAGPSNDGSDGDASAPGVAEALGHQGVPEGEQPVDTTAVALPRAA